MIRKALAATALLATTPLAAQSTTQDELDARYDRALAAGYKALMLCSAISSAENARQNRTAQSVLDWELTGIQQPLADLVGELPYEIHRRADGERVMHVEVEWAQDMPPRIARSFGAGCTLGPIGIAIPEDETSADYQPPKFRERDRRYPTDTLPREVQDGAFSDAYGQGTRTTAVLISKEGRPLIARFAEGFDEDTPQRTWSVAKSIAATYLGALVHRGDLDMYESAGLGLNSVDPRRAITFDHLLRMASGRYSDTAGNRTDPTYFGGATVAERAAQWPLLHPPGSVFRYANNDTLMAVERAVFHKSSFLPEQLLGRLRMSDTIPEKDWSAALLARPSQWTDEVDIQSMLDAMAKRPSRDYSGGYILSSQVWSSPKDLARLGQLYLDGGVGPDGSRILPAGWVQYVSSPSGPQPDGPFGYGAGFWLFNNSDGVPADTFAAMGNRGQYVVIVPSLNIVIVRRGEDPSGSRFDIAAFTRNILESLGK